MTDNTPKEREALASMQEIQPELNKLFSVHSETTPTEPQERLLHSTNRAHELPVELSNDGQTVPQSVYYLAYGSNLSAETFLGKRGIKPISQANVVVPSLRLTFDLPGIPYNEPCFANSGRREEAEPPTAASPSYNDEKSALLYKQTSQRPDYHKNRWAKGLVGVVYELTPQDYAHVIATEGGGASYQDIQVDCYPLLPGSQHVPDPPVTSPIRAHTLFAPPLEPSCRDGGRPTRPDADYAQASLRYLTLIRHGAVEHQLPQEYRDYLDGIRHYRPTTLSQRIGKVLFSTLWMPLIIGLFSLGKFFADEKGRNPDWLIKLGEMLFLTMWKSYDSGFKQTFGDGERTVDEEDAERLKFKGEKADHSV